RARAADGALCRRAHGRGAGGGDARVRDRRRPLRPRGVTGARRSVRSPALRAARARVRRGPLERVRRATGMLKAHSRLLEHLALITDLVLIAACWLGAYAVRFGLFARGDIPPFSDYALQLVPIMVVWFIAFKTFDLYRPNRLGSHLSECFGIASASALALLV